MQDSPSTAANSTALPRDVETERGFIVRTFYTRGGNNISQQFTEAKTAGIDASWFSDPASRLIWSAAEEIFKGENFKGINLIQIQRIANRLAAQSKNEDEKSVKISSAFFENAQYLVRGYDDFGTYVRMLRDAAIGRKTREVMSVAAEELASGEDAQSVVSRLIVQSQAILKGAAPSSKVSIASLADQIVAEYEEAHRQIVELGNTEYTPGVRLPWRKLAHHLNGMTDGVYILAARPGVGKTALALNFARFWTSIGLNVVFNSIDMSPKSYIKRQLVEMSRISQRKMQFARSGDYYAQDIAKIKAEVAELKKLEASGHFALYAEHDIEKFKAYCAILKDQGKLDILIIDYLQLMTFKGAMRMGTTQQTTIVSNLIHEMSVELGIPILCLSQLNRDNTKEGGREPELSDLRQSGAIEQDATAVMLLYRDETIRNRWRDQSPPAQYNPNMVISDSLRAICPVWMKIAKSREGDEGVKIPFVAMQSKYAWYIGDYDAPDTASKFARVYDDWRHDPIEKEWEKNGALIRTADAIAIEKKNRELFAAQKRQSKSASAQQAPATRQAQPDPADLDQDQDPETAIAQEGGMF